MVSNLRTSITLLGALLFTFATTDEIPEVPEASDDDSGSSSRSGLERFYDAVDREHDSLGYGVTSGMLPFCHTTV